MLNEDVYRQVAELHASNINQGFLSSLGIRFLTLLYEAIDANESSVLLIVEHEGRVVGFISGAEGMGSIYRHLLLRWPRLLLALLPALVSPRKLWKIAEILLMPQKPAPIPSAPSAELLSIAVHPAHRRKGYAQQLYRQLMQHFGHRSVEQFRIVVGGSLDEAHRFYKNMGAYPAGELEVHKGQRSVMYVHQLHHPAQSSHE